MKKTMLYLAYLNIIPTFFITGFFLGTFFLALPLIFLTDVFGIAFLTFFLSAEIFGFFVSFFVLLAVLTVLAAFTVFFAFAVIFFPAFVKPFAVFFVAIMPVGKAVNDAFDPDAPPNFLTSSSISFAIPPTWRARTSEAYTWSINAKMKNQTAPSWTKCIFMSYTTIVIQSWYVIFCKNACLLIYRIIDAVEHFVNDQLY